ncbi:alcohol dehydrogenase catalytic domain-containing protein [Virgibacillus alimentarius]|uniref:Ribitol-5-phosphate 2-dehydrogenase n=1 Tax=Virgibacillus alimentarius TaxID=698769 RepID=A0ABS4S8E8_9BACI|nr:MULTISPECIES: alcohol dehydrogenase catalytic domain-containing protein [Virgibacillus]MBP2257766.1 ribitol-5-phosphate 2-dehydrogenase [Virgibacillus alimentarius]HLR68648.1 alcohol dehydrogenase catalytic domain-containing protein [Virgibacillus sp.]
MHADTETNITSAAYRLIEPGVFKKQTIEHEVKENDVVVEPYMASVCHADLRYYTGNRRKEALEAKLPMSLFHEALGIVKESYHPDFKQGDRVVVVPSIPGYVLNNQSKSDCCDNCKNDGYDNYCLNGAFLGSGYDGAGQSRLVIGGENVVHVPEDLADDIAILAELCSVSLFAINLIEDLTTKTSNKVAVFGDGPLGYLTASALHFIYQIPKENLLVFGAIPEKIAQFDRFATTALVQEYDFNSEKGVKTVFECTGGKFSSSAINQAIDLLDVQGNLTLMGVTEDLVPMNTRDILEKGIRVRGSSRSTVKEFKQLMDAFLNEDYQNVLSKLIPKEHFVVRSTKDLTEAMEADAKDKGWKKTYLTFDWNQKASS